MIKKYRIKGTEKPTHKFCENTFWEDKIDGSIRFFDNEIRFNQFLEANNFEEVPEVKLPEVGKRYKEKQTEKEFELVVIGKFNVCLMVKTGAWEGDLRIEKFDDLRIYFEELPNQEEIKESEIPKIAKEIKEKVSPIINNMSESEIDKLVFGCDRVEKEKTKNTVCAKAAKEMTTVESRIMRFEKAKEELRKTLDSGKEIAKNEDDICLYVANLGKNAKNLLDALNETNLSDKQFSQSEGETKEPEKSHDSKQWAREQIEKNNPTNNN
jgi:hypothetical protein